MNTLIAFFSRADENYFGGDFRYVKVGNTEIAAEILKGILKSDSYKIEMETPYSPVYRECVGQAVEDFKSNARPPLKASLPEIVQYDAVFLCYPCYCGTAPMAVFTFLEQFDWAGKIILPICTNEGSGMGNSEADIQAACPGAEVRKGLSILGSKAAESEPLLKLWLADSGI